MIPLKSWLHNEPLSPDHINQLVKAVLELQRYSVTSIGGNLQFAANTLISPFPPLSSKIHGGVVQHCYGLNGARVNEPDDAYGIKTHAVAGVVVLECPLNGETWTGDQKWLLATRTDIESPVIEPEGHDGETELPSRVFSQAAYYHIKPGDVIAWSDWEGIPQSEIQSGICNDIGGGVSPSIYDGYVIANVGADGAKLSVPIIDSFWARLTGTIGTPPTAYTYEEIDYGETGAIRTGYATEINDVTGLTGSIVRIFQTPLTRAAFFVWGSGGIYTDGPGITIDGTKIETDLNGNKGLGYTGSGDTAQVAIMLASSASGLAFDGSGNLEVVVDTTKGINVDLSGANTGIGIQLDGKHGLTFDESGNIQAPIDSEHNSTYYNSSGELAVKLKTDGGLRYGDDTNGLGVDTDCYGIVIRDGKVATASQSNIEYIIFSSCICGTNRGVQVKRQNCTELENHFEPYKIILIPGTGLIYDVQDVG
jgi:hypothetical protein